MRVGVRIILASTARSSLQSLGRGIRSRLPLLFGVSVLLPARGSAPDGSHRALTAEGTLLQPAMLCDTFRHCLQACTQCVGRTYWLERARSSAAPSGSGASNATSAAAVLLPISRSGSVAHPLLERASPLLCRGIRAPALQVEAAAGSGEERAAQERKYQPLDAEAFLALFDEDTAKSFPVRCASLTLE